MTHRAFGQSYEEQLARPHRLGKEKTCPNVKTLIFDGETKQVMGIKYAESLRRCYYVLNWDGSGVEQSRVMAWSTFSDLPTPTYLAEQESFRKLGTLMGTTQIPSGQSFAGTSWMAVNYGQAVVDPALYFSREMEPSYVPTCQSNAERIPQLVYDLYKGAAEKGLSTSAFDPANVWFDVEFSTATFIAFPSSQSVDSNDAESIASAAQVAAAAQWIPSMCHSA